MNVKKLSEYADRLLFMTGTALENKVDEMVSLIRILQPKVASQIQGMVSISVAPQFRQAVAPVYYRRKREDVLTELPELIESKEWCTLSRAEEMAYEQAVLSKNYAEARRVSWNVENIADSSKAARLIELVEEAKSDGRKIIVFSFFLDTIHQVALLLGDRCTNPINGSVTPQRRQEIIDEFDKSPPGTVLVAQIQSGGTGLNIQSASVVILCEPQFKPSIENQAISRAYRMGQTRNVLVYRLLCENTVDEKIMSTLESKQKIFDAFADKSIAAIESAEMDERTFGNIIKEEIDRINSKHGNPATPV
jgi:SNF2 family DNA or RNA helicase